MMHCKLNLVKPSVLESPKEEREKLNEEVSYKKCHSFFHLKMRNFFCIQAMSEGLRDGYLKLFRTYISILFNQDSSSIT